LIRPSSPLISAAVFRRDISNTDPVAQKYGTARPTTSASEPASVYRKIICLRLLEYGAVGFAWRVTKTHRQKYLPWSFQPNFNETILWESLQTEGFHDTRYFDTCKQLGAQTLKDLKFADVNMIEEASCSAKLLPIHVAKLKAYCQNLILDNEKSIPSGNNTVDNTKVLCFPSLSLSFMAFPLSHRLACLSP